MRIVVIGATGNAGTSVLDALSRDDGVESILGIARRRPGLELPKVAWLEADVAGDPLEPLLRGADVVIHLAWLIQPSRGSHTRATLSPRARRASRRSGLAAIPRPVVGDEDRRRPADGGARGGARRADGAGRGVRRTARARDRGREGGLQEARRALDEERRSPSQRSAVTSPSGAAASAGS